MPDLRTLRTSTIEVLRSFFAVLLSLSTVALTPARAQGQAAQGVRQEVTPPVAQAIPKKLKAHGHVRIDDYHWLNERENPQVIAYLEAENAYTAEVMAHTTELQEALFDEIKGRIKQTDLSVPFKEDDYFYYYKTEEGK